MDELGGNMRICELNKQQAIKKVNEYLGNTCLNLQNTHFANNKKETVWWLNIPPQKFADELHILLVKNVEGGLIWLKISPNTVRDPERSFRIRGDNGSIDLGICRQTFDSDYLKDTYSRDGYDFRPHIEHEWEE